MNKSTIFSIFALFTTLTAQAQKAELGWGAEITSQYIWRGMHSAGPQIQPRVTVNAGQFSAMAWLSYGPADWKFDDTFQEFDIVLSYTLNHWTMGLTNYYHFTNGLFDWRNDYLDSGTQLEASLKYTVSDSFPLSIAAYTVIAGSDGYYPGKWEGEPLKRAYSTYVEFCYNWENQDKGLNYALFAGFTPWKGMYSGYQTAGVNNLSARIDKSWNLNKGTLSVFLQPTLNLISAHKLNWLEEMVSSGKSQSSFQWGTNANISAGLGVSF